MFSTYTVLPSSTANDIEVIIVGLETVFNIIVGHSQTIAMLLGKCLMIVVRLVRITTLLVNWETK